MGSEGRKKKTCKLSIHGPSNNILDISNIEFNSFLKIGAKNLKRYVLASTEFYKTIKF